MSKKGALEKIPGVLIHEFSLMKFIIVCVSCGEEKKHVLYTGEISKGYREIFEDFQANNCADKKNIKAVCVGGGFLEFSGWDPISIVVSSKSSLYGRADPRITKELLLGEMSGIDVVFKA